MCSSAGLSSETEQLKSEKEMDSFITICFYCFYRGSDSMD
jgi:hypothetical protein